MIILLSMSAGLLMRKAVRNPFMGLANVHLKGETLLLVLLVAQVVAPSLHLQGTAARVAFVLWALTFPAMLSVAWVNRTEPGMPLLGLGLLLNMVVIYGNGGMPVDSSAVAAIRQGAHAVIPAGDFVHIAAGAARLPWLADILPLNGPSWIRIIASPGDCLLAAGIAAFIACSGAREARCTRTS